MTAIRFSLVTERETLDLPRTAALMLLCFLISAWLHLILFTAWEFLAGEVPGLFRFELAAPPAPLEIVLTLEAEEEAGKDAGEQPEPGAAALELLEEEEEDEAAGEAPALDPAIDPARARLLPDESSPAPPVTVEPEAPRFKSYNTSVRGSVAAKWLVPPEARINFHPGRLMVNCTIGRDGNLIRFVVEESTGNAILDHAGLEALRSAAPFPPFPPELAAFSQLEITMIFDYQARYLGRE